MFAAACAAPLERDETAGAYDPEEGEVAATSQALIVSDAQKALAAKVNATVVDGPAPTYLSKIGGGNFTMVKNWDFGAKGNVKNRADLAKEFMFHDHWGTIANGANYGAVTVAPTVETAIAAPGLGLPNDRQPIEDPSRPTWTWDDNAMHAFVRPLSPSQSTVSATKHNLTNGSITTKWALPKGGSLLGNDIVWETRVRMPVATKGYWFALWTAGKQWSMGAEMDVLESFGTQYCPGNAFHVNSVGGVDKTDYTNWFTGLKTSGVPSASRNLTEWHTFTWVYRKDDTFEVFFDGYSVQKGNIHWTYTGKKGAAPVDMNFLFDFSWGHTTVNEVKIEMPAANFLLSYDIDYSRVYIR
jgi:hypothetical protein